LIVDGGFPLPAPPPEGDKTVLRSGFSGSRFKNRLKVVRPKAEGKEGSWFTV